MSSAGTWLLYGANGFTGRLIAADAAERKLSPILAGRNERAVREVAEPLGFEWRIFRLDDPVGLSRGLEGIRAILLAAGPFSDTSAPVVEACLTQGVHYLDVTGEIPVFEAVFSRDAEARERDVALLPGVGFDVVPTDCLAAALVEALPEADRLILAIAPGGGRPSAGTARTILEGLGRGGAARRGGRLVGEPLAYHRATIPFADRPRPAVSIPWGDLSTAWRSTRIPNIAVMMAVPKPMATALRALGIGAAALRLGPVRRAALRALESWAQGPGEETRLTAMSRLWGRVTAPDGRRAEGTAATPEGYRFTAVAAVESARRLAADPAHWRGALTPSQAFGSGFLAELPGCTLTVGSVTGVD